MIVYTRTQTYFDAPDETIDHESLTRECLFQSCYGSSCQQAPSEELGKYHNESVKDRGPADAPVQLLHSGV